MTHAATAPELVLYRTSGKWSKLRAAFLAPRIIYRARINQTFTSTDGVLTITYDTGSGTLASVKPDMTVLIGSAVDDYDIGIVRLRTIDATKFYIGETSDVAFADNQYLTVIDDFGLWARHVYIDANEVVYMDGGTTYTNQHTNFDPVPIMGSHRVVKLTGASVAVAFSLSSSYVVDGSSITGYSTTCPTATSVTNSTTSTPTVNINAVGWHAVYSAIQAANGKTFEGVRYIYVWNDANKPPQVSIESLHQDRETGGWSGTFSMFQNAGSDVIRDRSLVIVFSEDHFGNTQSDIGPVAGSENIELVGWTTKEEVVLHPEDGKVTFSVHGAHYWFQQIPSYPDGVEFNANTATAWTNISQLTVRKGLFHFLRWRTTATRIMDVFLTTDTKLTKEVSSLASNLWAQIQEMAWLQIFAQPGVNAQGQLYVEEHPQLVPSAGRTWPTVMTITKDDWSDAINFERIILKPIAIVTLSGVAINSAGGGVPYFSMAPGHAYPRVGSLEVQDNLLLESQAQSNTLAGLYRSWRNNQYPSIPVTLSADIRLIDCFPRQKCSITISASDTPRGLTYSGGLIPVAIDVYRDANNGHTWREVTFEAETFESQAVTHTVPGEGDRSIPPVPPLPAFPTFPPIFPGTPPSSDGGPKKVILWERTKGLIYTENFNDSAPDYYTINAGLGTTVWGVLAYSSFHRFLVTPGGQIYVYRMASFEQYHYDNQLSHSYPFLYRAPTIGGTFSLLVDAITLGRPGVGQRRGIFAAGVNGLLPDTIVAAIQAGSSPIAAYRFVSGVPTLGYSGGLPDIGGGAGWPCEITYGLERWLYTQGTHKYILSADASSLVSSATFPHNILLFNPEYPSMVRVSTTGMTYHDGSTDKDLIVGQNNLGSTTTNTFTDDLDFRAFATNPTGSLIMGRYGLPGNLKKGKSSDYGSTFSFLPNLPVGNWTFRWAGGSGVSNSRWIAGGADVRVTHDFGDTWVNKTSTSLTSISPFPDIIGIHVVEY